MNGIHYNMAANFHLCSAFKLFESPDFPITTVNRFLTISVLDTERII